VSLWKNPILDVRQDLEMKVNGRRLEKNVTPLSGAMKVQGPPPGANVQ